jgi:hypothetical protein
MLLVDLLAAGFEVLARSDMGTVVDSLAAKLHDYLAVAVADRDDRRLRLTVHGDHVPFDPFVFSAASVAARALPALLIGEPTGVSSWSDTRAGAAWTVSVPAVSKPCTAPLSSTARTSNVNVVPAAPSSTWSGSVHVTDCPVGPEP